ncbi:MAG: hypothetical protein JO113_04785 [Candidatus Eremiobacteraeota bacterium]|nr:hypothetical protein [Candidatus Eremiobacteraeota bacterium]
MSRRIPGGISWKVALFPPVASVTVLVDGRPMAAYHHAYVSGGRVFAPVDPLLMRLADRLWIDGGTLIVERDGRRTRVGLARGVATALNAAYVPVGPVLRALGLAVRYDAATHRLLVNVPVAAVVASPTPFNAMAPSALPKAVFTPAPPLTPRPVWTGSPLPRRTALPFPPPD